MATATSTASRGKPPLPPEEQKTHQIHVAVKKADKEAFLEFANRRGGVSAVLRRFIQRCIDEPDGGWMNEAGI